MAEYSSRGFLFNSRFRWTPQRFHFVESTEATLQRSFSFQFCHDLFGFGNRSFFWCGCRTLILERMHLRREPPSHFVESILGSNSAGDVEQKRTDHRRSWMTETSRSRRDRSPHDVLLLLAL